MSVGEGHDPERFYHCDCVEGGYDPSAARADAAEAELASVRLLLEHEREIAKAALAELGRLKTRDHAAGLSSISEAADGASDHPPPAGVSRQAGTLAGGTSDDRRNECAR